MKNLHSYSFRMGLEAPISREGSGFLNFQNLNQGILGEEVLLLRNFQVTHQRVVGRSNFSRKIIVGPWATDFLKISNLERVQFVGKF